MSHFLKKLSKARIPAFAGMTEKLISWRGAIGISIALVVSVLATTASAQISTGIPPLSNAAGATALLCIILNVMFWALLATSIVMVLWGAYLYTLAGDEPAKASQARMTILYAVIGVVIAFTAKGFPVIVASIFPGASVSSCSGSYNTSNIKYNL